MQEAEGLLDTLECQEVATLKNLLQSLYMEGFATYLQNAGLEKKRVLVESLAKKYGLGAAEVIRGMDRLGIVGWGLDINGCAQ